MTGEAASADTVAAEKFVQELQHIIKEGGYIHLNKFSTLRLLCSGTHAFQDLYLLR
jgi:hypothetical protein